MKCFFYILSMLYYPITCICINVSVCVDMFVCVYICNYVNVQFV